MLEIGGLSANLSGKMLVLNYWTACFSKSHAHSITNPPIRGTPNHATNGGSFFLGFSALMFGTQLRAAF